MSRKNRVSVEIRYINLEQRPERRLEMEARLEAVGLLSYSDRFRALTGEETPERVVATEWDSRLNARFDKTTLPHPRVPMTSGERGCAMSHACLWATAARRPDDSWPLVVLEDDVELIPTFAVHLARIIAKVHDTFAPDKRALVVYLGGDVAAWAQDPLNHPARKARLKADASGLFDIKDRKALLHTSVKLLAASYVWQTSSYVLWPLAAKRLVADLPVREPVDNFISRHLLDDHVHALVALPCLARQVAAYCDGDIVHSRPALACPDGDKANTPLAPIW